MKRILILLTASILTLPISIGLLYHKSPIVLSEGGKLQKEITYLETKKNKIHHCDMEEYLIGVLAAEMPAEYHIEALKAQAVAARSFIISRMNSKNSNHPNAVVCDDPNHCKAYLDEDEARKKWPEKEGDKYRNKLEEAVKSTCGEYMLCEEQVVEAFFFARSGGRTENSEDVWGEERPYLKSVESEGDKTHPEFESVAEFSVADARNRLKSMNTSISSGNKPVEIGEIVRTAGGSVGSVKIDGITFRGKDIRTAFGLKSADFTASCSGDKVRFNVFGYGHGVGMSQFGANYMAERGKNYTEILSHYYTNIQIITY